jgi:hypothetical protein
MRYFTMPAGHINITSYKPGTSEPIVYEASVREGFRTIFGDPRFVQVLGTFDAYDLRKKFLDSAPKDVIELRDQEHSVMRDVVTRPATGLFNPDLLTSDDGIAFLRSIVDMPTTKPTPSS